MTARAGIPSSAHLSFLPRPGESLVVVGCDKVHACLDGLAIVVLPRRRFQSHRTRSGRRRHSETLGVSCPRVNELVHAKRDMTPHTALRRERLLGGEAQFCLNLQLAGVLS